MSLGSEIRISGHIVRYTQNMGADVFTVFGRKMPNGGRPFLAHFPTLESAKAFARSE